MQIVIEKLNRLTFNTYTYDIILEQYRIYKNGIVIYINTERQCIKYLNDILLEREK